MVLVSGGDVLCGNGGDVLCRRGIQKKKKTVLARACGRARGKTREKRTVLARACGRAREKNKRKEDGVSERRRS
jgi:hypothetical protein